MRIIHLLLIGILISLTAAASAGKSDSSKGGVDKQVASSGEADKQVAPAGITTAALASATNGRSVKVLKSTKPGDNRGKRTLYDFGNAGYLYPQVAARRGGYSPDPRTAYSTQPGFYSGQNGIAPYPSEYNYNYGPYPQYIEAPEPIIEIIIKDANETLPGVNAQPTVTKTKKKKEKVHVFYVNYKKDENNKLHLESPIASLNNDDAEEEEEEEEVVEYPVTPLPPIKSTTLRTIIHPDSEKYHSNSGIHVTFGSEDKSQRGQILEEHDAESIQRQVVAVPIPQSSGLKTQYPGNARQDFHGHARSPFANNFFQSSSANVQYQPTAQQQLPNQHATSFFRVPLQQQQPQQHQSSQYSQNYHQQKTPTQQKSPFNSQLPQSPAHQQHHQTQPQQQQQIQQQQQRKPLTQIHHHIQQQLQQQSQYYVNHNQFYQPQQQSQQQQQSQNQNGQYYNSFPQKATQSPKKSIVFPTPPPKSQELPNRQPPQPYQPIKFRPTPASAVTQTKPTPIAAKLENSHYNSKPYQFQRQPQFIQQPTFTVQSPTVPPPPQHYKQQSQSQTQQQQQHHQQLIHPQTSNYQGSSVYYTQNKNQQQHSAPVQHQSKYQSQTSPAGTIPGLSWLDIKPSKETELLKSIPKFEQHITETIQNNYQPGNGYQAQNQVIHDIPAPNLAPQQQQQQQQLQSQYHNSNSFNSQTQQQFSNFVTTSTNVGHNQQIATSTQAPQFVESTDGQKIMVVTPMPPNVYQQYQTVHYPTSSQGNQQQSTQIVTSINHSQDQYNNYFQQQQQHQQLQQPRQGSAQVQSEIKQSSQLANTPFSVSTYHSDVFKELEQRKSQETPHPQNAAYIPSRDNSRLPSTSANEGTTTTTPNPKALLQLPDEVPDDLRQQLLSSGILSNADISVLDYDKEGDIALENLPAEHLQHFYGAGGGAQISESKKVLTVLKPNGDKVSLDEKEIERVKESSSVPLAKQSDAKVVRFDSQRESLGNSYSAERQYNRYLPLKINAANFPKPDAEELRSKTLQSIVVLAPVDTPIGTDDALVEDSKEVKFLGGDLIKVLVKKPTKDNFKRWLEKESRTDVDHQSVVLLVTKAPNLLDQEIFMYDIANGEVNKLNGELSSKFVSVAEENASTEDLEHGSTLDPTFLETMMQKTTR